MAKNKKSKDKKNKEAVEIPPLEFRHEPPSMIAERLLSDGIIIWRRNSMGVRVQQLQTDMYYAVVDFLQLHTAVEDPMSNLLKLIKKWNPIEEMLDNAIDWFSKCLSFVAIDEATEAVCGTLIGRIMYSNRARAEVDELKSMLEAELKEEEEMRILKLKADEVVTRKTIADRKMIRRRTAPSLVKKKKTPKFGDFYDYDDDFLDSIKDKIWPSYNASAAYNRTEGQKKNGENLIDEETETEDEVVEIKKKGKTETSRPKDKDKNEGKGEKVIQVFEPPEDDIPVEVKSSPPTHVFDDTYKNYKDQTLRHFMKIRYKLFHHFNLMRASEALCYYKIYVWSVSEPFQNRGIGSDLLDAAEEMCYQLEIPMMAVICTSQKSQRIATRSDFVPITKLYYKNMIGRELKDEKVAVAQIKYLNVPILTTYQEITEEKVEDKDGKKKEENEGTKDKKSKK